MEPELLFKKKVRGLGRRLSTFSKYLNEQIDSLPVQNNKDPNYKGYTSLHIPFSMFLPIQRMFQLT